MKLQTKIATFLLALAFFSQGCAVFIEDDFHHRHRHFRRHRHGSLEQPYQDMAHSRMAFNLSVDQATSSAPEK